MFLSNGVDQRLVDFNMRPQALVGADNTTVSGRTRVDPSTLTDAAHIIFIGQSTNSNHLDGTATPVHGSSIFNLSIGHRGACFVAVEPLLFASAVNGHHGMYLADSLIANGVASKVLLTNIICGGNYAADWVPGGGVVGGAQAGNRPGELAYRIALAARCIANAGLSGLKTIIDWQQGEWDSNDVCTPQANYEAAMRSIIAEFKRVGLLRAGNVMFINQCTRLANTPENRNPIRAAQAAIPDGDLVRAGFDVDTITTADRQADGTHLKVSGGILQAAGKYPGIADFIQNG